MSYIIKYKRKLFDPLKRGVVNNVADLDIKDGHAVFYGSNGKVLAIVNSGEFTKIIPK